MSGGDDEKPKEDKTDEVAAQVMQYAAIPGFMGNAQGLLAEQLSKGGYGSAQGISGILGQIHQPMNMGHVVDPASGNPLYSGGAYMATLREQLKGQGVETQPGASTPSATGWSGRNGGEIDPQIAWYRAQTRGNR